MICSRCGKIVNTERPERNAEVYGTGNVFACPYCGKAHYFSRVVKVDIKPINSSYEKDDYSSYEEDDWGNVIISDKEYEKIQRLKR